MPQALVKIASLETLDEAGPDQLLARLVSASRNLLETRISILCSFFVIKTKIPWIPDLRAAIVAASPIGVPLSDATVWITVVRFVSPSIRRNSFRAASIATESKRLASSMTFELRFRCSSVVD